MANISAGITRLDALNTIASYIGIPPLDDIINLSREPDFTLFDKVLEEVKHQELSRGLDFNTDIDYSLNFEPLSGFVEIPEEALSVDVSEPLQNHIIERDGKLYDRKEQTFNLFRDYKVTIKWNQDFDCLPVIAKRYYTLLASHKSVIRLKGTTEILEFMNLDLLEARTEYNRWSERVSDTNMLDNSETYYIISDGSDGSFHSHNRR